MKKAREFQKNIYYCFIDYAQTCDCVDHNKANGGDGIPVDLFQILR